jgi:hypothetical protein
MFAPLPRINRSLEGGYPSSCSDKRLALPPAAVVSVDTPAHDMEDRAEHLPFEPRRAVDPEGMQGEEGAVLAKFPFPRE